MGRKRQPRRSRRRTRQAKVDGRQLVRDAIAVSFLPWWKERRLLELLDVGQLETERVAGLTDPDAACALVAHAAERLEPDTSYSPTLVVLSAHRGADGQPELRAPTPLAERPAARVRAGSLLDRTDVAEWADYLRVEIGAVPEQEIRDAVATYLDWTPPQGLERVRWGRVRLNLEKVAEHADAIGRELDSFGRKTFRECIERDRTGSIVRRWGAKWVPVPGKGRMRQELQTEIRQTLERLPLLAAAARLGAAECRQHEKTGSVGDEAFGDFVVALGRVYTQCTGSDPSAGYNKESGGYGQFADFVSAVMTSLHHALAHLAPRGKSPFAGAQRPHFGKRVQRALSRHRKATAKVEAALRTIFESGASDTTNTK
jgi:hypothetical protein